MRVQYCFYHGRLYRHSDCYGRPGFQGCGLRRHAFCTFIAISFVFNGAHFITNAAFNNLGYPMWSTLTNWGKATVRTIPFVLVGAHWYGAEGALAGQAVGAVLFGVMTVVMALRLTQRLLLETTAKSQN